MNALELWLPSWYQATVPPPLSSGDLFTDFVNAYSGVLDAVTLGATGYLRQQTGMAQYVDTTSAMYGFGQVLGSVIVSVAAWGLAGGLGQVGTALRWAMVGEGVLNGAQQIAEGNIAAGVLSIGMSVLGASAICGVGLCSLIGQTAARAVIGATAVSGAVVGVQGISQMYNGSYVTGFSNFLMGAAALFAASQTQACFEAGTPIRTPDGWKAIEELKIGEWVLSRSDKDADGEVRARRVVQTFERYADVVNVLVSGKVIGTTAEHPFYVKERGWQAAGELKEGDLLRGEEGWEICGEVRATGRHVKVYNVEVEEYHTYFVGGEEWGYSVWRIMLVQDMLKVSYPLPVNTRPTRLTLHKQKQQLLQGYRVKEIVLLQLVSYNLTMVDPQ